jgi:hypothetical protein
MNYIAAVERERERVRQRFAWCRFAQIMEHVWRALLQEERKRRLLSRYQAIQRFDSYGVRMDWSRAHTDRVLRHEMSDEWSRRVREGVKAIRPLGPRVYCQSEED